MDIETRQNAEILRERGIRRVRYFHCDHFEPWSLGVTKSTLRGVERFREMTGKSRYGRKLSLFYSCYVPYFEVDPAAPRSAHIPGDAIAFSPYEERSPRMAEDVIGVIRPLVEDGHEAHLHVHHEWWTRNGAQLNSPVWRWVNAHSTPERDEARLELFIDLSKKVIAAETGRPFDRWAFVHGNWALCASDDEICRIQNELAILMRHGCWGDFTFPAGRGHCDSATQQPFTCLPVPGRRAFDLPEASQILVAPEARAMTRDRFFIWASRIKARASSLDWYSAANVELFRQPWTMIDQWTSQSMTFGDTLYLKTHAHSMKWEYKLGDSDSPVPHAYPDVVRLFENFERVCDAAGASFECVTVNEVMEDLAAIDGGRPPGEFLPAPARPIALLGQTAVAAERVMSDSLVAWINTGEKEAAQAGEYYVQPARRDGRLELRPDEVAAARYVAANFPQQSTQILEIGPGLGMLSGVIAAAGFDVVALEGGSGRIEGLERGAAALRAAIGRGFRVRNGLFPQNLTGDLIEGKPRHVALMTNIVHGSVAANRDAFLRACAAFDDVIIDLGRFGRPLDAGAERDGLREALGRRLGASQVIYEDRHHLMVHVRPAPIDPGAAGGPPEPRFSAEVAEVVAAVAAARTGLGVDAPADPSYIQRIDRGTFVDPDELSAALVFLRPFEKPQTLFVEIGSGQGGLAASLAMLGYSVLGYEGVGARVAIARRLAEALGPRVGDRLRFHAGLFPRDMIALPLSPAIRKAAFVGNVVGTYSGARQDRILRALSAFDEVLIEASRFGVNRDAPEQRDAFLKAVAANHFDVEGLAFRAKTVEYWRLRPRRVITE